MQFETRIQGIPCIAEMVDTEDFIFRVLDRNGRPAAWLERKMTDKDYDQLENDYFAQLEEECAP
jgi:hypothetical protein